MIEEIIFTIQFSSCTNFVSKDMSNNIWKSEIKTLEYQTIAGALLKVNVNNFVMSLQVD